MSTSLSINRQNGNVPKSLPGEDHITGLVIYMAAGDIPASFKTERVQPLSTIDAAEAAGIVDYTTAADGTQTAAPWAVRVLHYHLSELYRINPAVSLYVGIFEKPQGDNMTFAEINTVQIHAVGHPANSFYLFQQVYDENGAPIEGVYVDQNGDGQIDEADKIINKSPDPKVTMTFGSQFRWKNWDLGFNIRASIGNYVYNNVLSTKAVYNDLFAYGLNNLVKNDYYFDQPRYMSDYYLRNASFVRCDNITLGYTWDNLIKGNLRLRLFGAVQNPFVITKYKGVDPEVFGGIDNSVYPRSTTYSLGLVATF